MKNNIISAELIKLTQNLINQPSITPNDHTCQNIISNYLKKLNFYIEPMRFNDTQNTWAYHIGKSKKVVLKKNKTLLFLGHTDVVSPGNIQDWIYPPFSGSIHNKVLYGRGSSDMKGAIAAMLIATKYFIKKYPNHKNRIAFLITSDEEGTGFNGTVKVIQSLIDRNESINYCIIGEPSSELQIGDVIKNGRRGSYTGNLKIYGSSGHVAYPKFLKNPIHLVIPALAELLNNTKWDKQKSKFFPKTSIQLTNIYTNQNACISNMTPSQLMLNFNFRFNDQTSVERIKNNINNILLSHKLVYDFDQEHISEPYWSVPKTLTNIVMKIIKNFQKIDPKIQTTGGTSDGRFIIKTGAEILELGALNHTIHKANECIRLSDLHILKDIYLKILEKVLL